MSENKKTGREYGKTLVTNLRNYLMYIALAVIFIVFQILSNGSFLTARNITNLINQTGYIAVMAVGMTLILIIRQIDLSVGFVAGFLGAAAARLLKAGVAVLPTILIVLAMGVMIGLVQGLIIGKVGVPAFITTLAFEFGFRGLLTLITEATGTIPIQSDVFYELSNGFIPELFKIGDLSGSCLIAGAISMALIVFSEIRKRKELKRYKFEDMPVLLFILKLLFFVALIGTLTVVLAGYRGISWTIVIVVIVVAIYSFVMNKTKVGRYIYGMGGNPEAAQLSGVDIKRILIGSFASMGLMAALGGILYTSRLGSATPTAGMGFELDAIASCYIAGVSTSGGVGSVANSVIGAFVIMSLTNGLNLIGVGISYQYLIKGIIFILAVALDVRSRGKKALG
ncbi:MAG TPA: sugar ABC transporter permease [Clostridia bacterium]|jgi:putative multiple sugar transport system permease protein|nr:MAG: Xylose transport system permease protein XylH [Firmicutes bacterium ADurb.Bin099]HHT94838.1 sugar ABC transporter permease [Clostridiaceae bacterium]HOF27452.1 sugar ABC transporter permease [Clostridia bacterium]HOR90383.1 sugar ABC transporter permease [Clostridia bacterium]HPL08754.1 sugar ABC transporter permease [Clostridia bacterium]